MVTLAQRYLIPIAIYLRTTAINDRLGKEWNINRLRLIKHSSVVQMTLISSLSELQT